MLSNKNLSELHLTVGGITVLGKVDGSDIKTITNSISALKSAAAAQASKQEDYWTTLASDNVITSVEKKTLYKEWKTIQSTYAALNSLADEAGIASSVSARTEYVSAYNSLLTYLYSTLKLFDDLETDTPLNDRNTFNLLYTNYYGDEFTLQEYINGVRITSANTGVYLNSANGNLSIPVALDGTVKSGVLPLTTACTLYSGVTPVTSGAAYSLDTSITGVSISETLGIVTIGADAVLSDYNEIGVVCTYNSVQYTATITITKAYPGVGVASIVYWYYLSSSDTSLIDGAWSTATPEWSAGKNIWVKIVVTYSDGSTTESSPVCMSGSNGYSVFLTQVSKVFPSSGEGYVEHQIFTTKVEAYKGDTPVDVVIGNIESPEGMGISWNDNVITIEVFEGSKMAVSGSIAIPVKLSYVLSRQRYGRITNYVMGRGTDVFGRGTGAFGRNSSVVFGRGSDVYGRITLADGTPQFNLVFSYGKSLSGEDSTVYSIEPSVSSVVKENDVLSENSITATVYKTTGSTPRAAVTYGQVYYKKDSDNEMKPYTGAVEVGNSTKYIDFYLYAENTLLDKERVPVVDNGIQYTVELTPPTYSFSGGSDGKIKTAQSIQISVAAKKVVNGAETEEVAPVIGELPAVSGFTLTKNGKIITLSAAANAEIAPAGYFVIPVTISVDGSTLSYSPVFTWVRTVNTSYSDVPKYLGMFASDPASPNTGDWYLYSGASTASRITGAIYRYNGAEWVVVNTATAQNAGMVQAAMTDMFTLCASMTTASGTTYASTLVALSSIVNVLFANDAFIEKLATKIITLKSGGVIQSEEFAKNGGVKIKADGTAIFSGTTNIGGNCTIGGICNVDKLHFDTVYDINAIDFTNGDIWRAGS